MTEPRPTATTRAVTRADVARYAGVSTAVVSYVINDGPRTVAPRTAARVREAIELLQYRPNVSAQALRRGTTEMVGVVLSDPTNPFFTEFAAAIGTAAFHRGHAMMIATARGLPEMETRLVDDLIRRQVDGLIVASVFSRPDLGLSRAHRGTPTVWIDAPGVVPGYASVGLDGRSGAATAVEHLLGTHRHPSVALVIGADPYHTDPRELGWLQAHSASGRTPGPVVRADWSREGGYAGGRELLARRDRPTAIFASSDLQGVGVLRAAHELGIRIPQDLAVIAFDGTKESEFCWPPMTVVAQPITAMAEQAVDLVLEGGRPNFFASFAGSLVIRQSCGCVLPRDES